MSTLTPLRGSASKDAAKVDPTPTNVAETLANPNLAAVVAQDEDKDDEGDEDEDEDDEGDEDEEQSKKGKGKAKRKAKTKTAYDPAAYQLAERSRIKAILESEAGKLLPRAAAHIALNTSLSAADAIGVLGGMQAEQILPSRQSTLSVKMDAEPKYAIGVEAPTLEDKSNPLATRVGADGSTIPANPSALAAAIIAAGKKRRGEV